MPRLLDGAIYGDLMFRFNSKGSCKVYELSELRNESNSVIELAPISEFTLDRAEEIVPHSNAVVFGNEFYAEGDEFPLLYSNIYNNYAKSDDKLVGVCCVYRLERIGDSFTATLVQLIEIGFSEEKGLWRSEGDITDVRPYGNFVVDSENGKYYAFVMRDGDKTTRYFAFDLPDVTDGVADERFGVKKVTLKKEDIIEHFDVPYHNFIQGAVMKNGKIYSVEGFHEKIHPAIRVIDTAKKNQELFFDFFDAGFPHEAEFIDFYKDRCLYSDAKGNIFEINF
ncbi:MAG: hypothetical protein E7634_08120 [Ruminococcaceae bacterium]|nr:hypothetical protein [Oscillospiraceae bacterium]